MVTMPLVSIIMNCYNSDRFLKEAIDSVYSQTYHRWEVIFWDNASTDQSAAIARSYDDRLKYFLALQTTPLGEARNLALGKAKGKYIAFCDCDDLYLPDKLEKQVQQLDNSDFPMSYGSAIIIDELGKVVRRRPVVNDSGTLLAPLLKRYEINIQSVMIRHAFLKENNLSFQANLKYSPDYNLFMTIASSYQIGVIKDYIVQYRVSKGALSNQSRHLVFNENKFTLDQIVRKKPELKEKYLVAFQYAYAKLYYYEAVRYIVEGNYRKAREQLTKTGWKRWEYMALYFLLWLRIPSKQIMKLLNR